jgi:glycosyltransferase involved in cell wall biosynthesis
VLCPGYAPYSHLPDWYGRADVFVHPAPDEPWGVSVTEALASGVPVLAAEGVGAAAEVLGTGACGSTFPNHDAQTLADRLINLATGKIKHPSLSQCKQTADEWHYNKSIESFKNALHQAKLQ